jgi:uncharacterized protein YjbJ (UPF0337 family)
MKSAQRDRMEGALEKIVGRLLEAIGRRTGRMSVEAKGKAARARGAARSRKSHIKRTLHLS